MGACASLGDDVLADYVDGMLPAEQERQVERHLVACQCCLTVVHEERELMAQLRDVRIDAQQHQQLMAGLLSLAGEEPARPDLRPAPATLTTHAPAQYCSARRSVAFTLAAVAGCLGAALTVSQVPSAGATSAPADSHDPGRASLSRSVPAAWTDGGLMSSRDITGTSRSRPLGQLTAVDAALPGR